MANKERIDYLLLDIRELEKKVAAMRDAEIYPVSFFSQSFQIAHKILTDLHTLESAQLDILSRQMEEHRKRLESIPLIQATPQPSLITEEEKVEAPMPEPEVQVNEPEANFEPEEPEMETIIVHRKKDAEPMPTFEEAVVEEKTTEPIKEEKLPPVINEIKGNISLNEILEKKNLSDFRKAFSLNDRFRFRRELFGGEENRMNQAIADLNDIHTYEDSITYLYEELQWNVEDEAVADFIKLIEKRFL